MLRFLEWEQTQSTFSLNPLDQVVRALGMKKLERRSAVVMQKDFVKNIRHSSLVAIEQVKVHKKASSAFLPSKSKLAPHLAVVKQAGKQAHTLVQWAGAGGGGGGEHVGRPDFKIVDSDSACPSLSAIPVFF